MNQTASNGKFSSLQKSILIGCLVAYTTAYLCRLNLSALLPQIIESLDISSAKAGFLQTAFAVVYSAGQFVNGAIVDRVNPVRHVMMGLLGSSLCNILMGFVPSYPLLLALCLLNGVFQSMLWTPIVRILAIFFITSRERTRANFVMALPLVPGHLGALALSGFLSSVLNWRAGFIVSGLIALPILGLIFFLLRGAIRLPRPAVHGDSAADGSSQAPVFPLFAASGFFFVLVSCIMLGFARDGMITWAPNILLDLSGGNSIVSTGSSLIIPLINAVGIIAGFAMVGKGGSNVRRVIALLLLFAGIFAVPLFFLRSPLLYALLIGCSCACHFGLGSLLTALVPLEYDRENRVGLCAGLIDSLIYVGSALAGVACGGIYDAAGLGMLAVVWAAVALAGALFMLLATRKMNTYRARR